MYRDIRQNANVFYVGRVVDNKDRWGRVRVRIHELDDDNESHELLFWAHVISLGGGFYDGGSAVSYPIGSTVLVGFLNGDIERPVVLGGIHKLPKSEWKYEEPDNTWHPKDETTDVPKDVIDNRTHVLYKSIKGHTISFNDNDENEELRIIDRGGQVIRMRYPVKKSENKGNKEQRGDRNIIDGSYVPLDKTSDSVEIEIRGVRGQVIRVVSSMTENKILLKASDNAYIEIDGENDTVTIVGRNRVDLNP